jgi:hypothetical protein
MSPPPNRFSDDGGICWGGQNRFQSSNDDYVANLAPGKGDGRSLWLDRNKWSREFQQARAGAAKRRKPTIAMTSQLAVARWSATAPAHFPCDQAGSWPAVKRGSHGKYRSH